LNIYVTVLSGDLLGNDDPVTVAKDLLNNPSRADNCYHVFYHPEGLALEGSSVLDGFVITGGQADQPLFSTPHRYGGGMYNKNSSPKVVHCHFTGNMADIYGGGMSNFTSSPTVSDCTFSLNLSIYNGGGQYRCGSVVCRWGGW